METLKKIWYVIAAVVGFILFGWWQSQQAREKAELSMEATTRTSADIDKELTDIEAEKRRVLEEPIKLPQDEDPEEYWNRVLEEEGDKKKQ